MADTQHKHNSLQGKLLVATPKLNKTMWAETVIYLVDHDVRSGAVGFVLNRLSNTPVNSLMDAFKYKHADFPEIIHMGGPLKERNIHMLHSGDWYSASTAPVTQEISWSYDDFMLEKMAGFDTPRDWTVFAGYSAWQRSQLEQEIVDGSWLVVDTNPAIVFATDRSYLYDLAVDCAGQQMIETFF